MICVVLLGLAPMLRAQMPVVSLSLPTGIDPASARVVYFMGGEFGGYGNFAQGSHDQFSYEIKASHDGKPADGISIVAYIPGCEFSAYRIDLRKERAPWRQVECVPLPALTFRGQYSPVIASEEPPEVVVWYEAGWINEFFGIMDGMVPQWELPVAKADPQGQFSLEIPNFCLQADFGDASEVARLHDRPFCEFGSLRFSLENPKTHAVYELETSGKQFFYPQRAYPEVVQFEIVPTMR